MFSLPTLQIYIYIYVFMYTGREKERKILEWRTEEEEWALSSVQPSLEGRYSSRSSARGWNRSLLLYFSPIKLVVRFHKELEGKDGGRRAFDMSRLPIHPSRNKRTDFQQEVENFYVQYRLYCTVEWSVHYTTNHQQQKQQQKQDH